MQRNFCAFILTHGRPDNVKTYKTLRAHGYTGRIVLVIDDEDKHGDAYREKYGDEVVQFSKGEMAKTFDEGDNFNDRRVIIYARNACFEIAKEIGASRFVQLDDDYSGFYYMIGADGATRKQKIVNLDWLFDQMVEYLDSTPFASIAMSQGGDHIGGRNTGTLKVNGTKRKAMNSFFCSTEKPFKFHGRINEDVNTYTGQQRAGLLFLTVNAADLEQQTTQAADGGMSGIYAESGTYVKSFYSVMYCPSGVVVSSISNCTRNASPRLHHRVNYNACAPKIIREQHKKAIQI
jgi:hypothetical protein